MASPGESGCGRLTLGQASEFCGLSQVEFQTMLGDQRILMHYDLEEFKHALQTLNEMSDPGRLTCAGRSPATVYTVTQSGDDPVPMFGL